MDFLIILAILFVLVLFVSAPLRHVREAGEAAAELRRLDGETELAELEAAREAKYREIRDAELDHQTGKLSDEDYAEIDAALRAEALEILDALEAAGGATIPSR
jgi:hypothetical protein